MFEIGTTLREARVRRKLTLQQVEDDTKIRVKYVQAMENEDFDVMPSPTYVKGFLQSYARYLGLDPHVILDEYKMRFMTDEETEPFGGSSALGRPRHPRRRSNLVFVAVVALLVLALIYIVGLSSRSSEPESGGPTTGISLSPTPTTTPKTTPTAKSSPTNTSPAAAGVVLTVRAASGDCWIEVRRGDQEGALLYMKTLPQGEKKTFRDDAALYMRVGIPASLRLTLGGKPLEPLTDVGPADYLVTRNKMEKL